jgi:hypothetical protein
MYVFCHDKGVKRLRTFHALLARANGIHIVEYKYRGRRGYGAVCSGLERV